MFDELYGLIVVVSLFVYGCVCVCARVWRGVPKTMRISFSGGWVGGFVMFVCPEGVVVSPDQERKEGRKKRLCLRVWCVRA